ncbi:MAG TPA: hypothetical protein VK964_02105 [Nocardioidaceae bacterium]|nr:hypothetical protein [Nocardioidaceae bacterium]
MLSGYVQAVHLETDFYETHYQAGPASPRTHCMKRWHADASGA